MDKNLQTTIAENIKKYRLLNKMTQKELSELLFLDTQYYAQLERCERNFTIEKIALICSLFHINIEDIIQIDTTESEQDCSLLQNEIHTQLSSLSYSQLQLVQNFITEIIPYTK